MRFHKFSEAHLAQFLFNRAKTFHRNFNNNKKKGFQLNEVQSTILTSNDLIYSIWICTRDEIIFQYSADDDERERIECAAVDSDIASFNATYSPIKNIISSLCAPDMCRIQLSREKLCSFLLPNSIFKTSSCCHSHYRKTTSSSY